MRWSISLAILSLASCVQSPVAPEPLLAGVEAREPAEPESRQRHRLSVRLGARSLDLEEIWDPVAEQFTAGLEYSQVSASGFGLEFGLNGSVGFEEGGDADFDVTGGILEGYGGLRKEFDWGRWRPSFGVGAAWIAAGIDNDAAGSLADDSDTSIGYYAHGGLLYDCSSSTFIGVDVRVLRGSEIEFDGLEGDADYEQITLVLGLRF